MTAKRFTIDYSNEYAMGVGFFDNGKRITIDNMVECLNELHDENQTLKKQLESEHTMLDNAILLERTRMGQNSLKQFKESLR